MAEKPVITGGKFYADELGMIQNSIWYSAEVLQWFSRTAILWWYTEFYIAGVRKERSGSSTKCLQVILLVWLFQSFVYYRFDTLSTVQAIGDSDIVSVVAEEDLRKVGQEGGW